MREHGDPGPLRAGFRRDDERRRALDERAWVRPWSEGNATGAFLTRFDVGSADVKHDHEAWLRAFSRRFPGMSGDLYVVALTGPPAGEEASRALAERRALGVYRLLRREARSLPWIGVHVGATRVSSRGSAPEVAARHRAVAVIHVSRGHVPVWLRGRLQVRPLPSNIFYLRAVAPGPAGAVRTGDPADEAPVRSADGPPAARPLHLEIGDGRWSVVYSAFPGSATGEGEGGDPGVRGPWHVFTSPFELTVEGFRGSAVRLSPTPRARDGMRLEIVRPAVTADPFVGHAAVAVEDAGRVGRLDPEGRPPDEHRIPEPIRAHLRRRGEPGPRSLE